MGGAGNHAGIEPMMCWMVLPIAQRTKTETIPFQKRATPIAAPAPAAERALHPTTVWAPSLLNQQPGGGVAAGSTAASSGALMRSVRRETVEQARQRATP